MDTIEVEKYIKDNCVSIINSNWLLPKYEIIKEWGKAIHEYSVYKVILDNGTPIILKTLLPISDFTNFSPNVDMTNDYYIGRVLNKYYDQIPNLMYTYAILNASPPFNDKPGSSFMSNDCNQQYLMLQYVPGKTLLEVRDELTEKEQDIIYFQISYVVDFLFKEIGFVHGDLHDGNIIIQRLNEKKYIYYGSFAVFTDLLAIIIDYGDSSLLNKIPGKQFIFEEDLVMKHPDSLFRDTTERVYDKPLVKQITDEPFWITKYYIKPILKLNMQMCLFDNEQNHLEDMEYRRYLPELDVSILDGTNPLYEYNLLTKNKKQKLKIFNVAYKLFTDNFKPNYKDPKGDFLKIYKKEKMIGIEILIDIIVRNSDVIKDETVRDYFLEIFNQHIKQ